MHAYQNHHAVLVRIFGYVCVEGKGAGHLNFEPVDIINP